MLVLVSLLPTNTPNWVRALAWSALAVFGVDAALSGFQTREPLAAGLALAHAGLAPVVVALMAALAVFTMIDWSLIPPERIEIPSGSYLPLEPGSRLCLS